MDGITEDKPILAHYRGYLRCFRSLLHFDPGVGRNADRRNNGNTNVGSCSDLRRDRWLRVPTYRPDFSIWFRDLHEHNAVGNYRSEHR